MSFSSESSCCSIKRRNIRYVLFNSYFVIFRQFFTKVGITASESIHELIKKLEGHNSD